MPATLTNNRKRVVPLTTFFPWVKYLDADEQREFFDALLSAVQTTLQKKDVSILQQVIEDWRATAQVNANPKLSKILQEPLTEADLIPWEEARASLPHRRHTKSGEGSRQTAARSARESRAVYRKRSR